MKASEIGVYLQSIGLGTRNVDADHTGDIFEGNGPDMPDEAIFIFPEQGRGFDLVHTNPRPNTEMPRLQIRVRSATYSTGEARVDNLVGAMTFHNKILADDRGNQVFYLSCVPIGTWSLIERDSKLRPIFGINFEIEKRLSS